MAKAERNLKAELKLLKLKIEKVDNLLKMLKDEADYISEALGEHTEIKLDEKEPVGGFDLKSFRDKCLGE